MAKKELNKKSSEFIVTIEADKKLWSEKQEQASKHLMNNLSIKGFRKGKVPADIAKKHISKTDIFAQAIKEILEVMVQEAHKEITEDIMVLDAPSYAVKEMAENKLVVDFVYPVYPEIKLPDYKKLGVKYKEEKLDDKLIDSEIAKVQNMQAMLKEKESGALAKGDIAVFDFEGFVDGKPFDGGKAEKYELEIGSGQFIPGFEDQMIGVKKGESKDVKVAFPKDYHAENLKGKDAVFKITLHGIKEKRAPKLDDEFVKTLGIKDVKTVEELRKHIATVFTEQEKQRARGAFHREAFAKILETTKIAIPAILVAKEMQKIEEQTIANMKKQGFSIEQYMEMTKTDMKQLRSEFKATAEAQLSNAFIFAELSKVENIELTDKDYDEQYEKLAKVYQQSVDGVKGMISKAQIQIPLTNEKVIDALIKYNK